MDERREIADGFQEDVVARLDALARAVAAGDRDEAWQLAHGIRGVAAYLGLTALAGECRRLQAWARGDDGVDARGAAGAVAEHARAAGERLDAAARAGDG
jgi:HPt (histidine-containing phosphotransfer) domain-containing protein